MSMTTRRVGVALVVTLAFVAGAVLDGPRPGSAAPDVADYRIRTSNSRAGYGTLVVKPTDMDWPSYVASNTARLRDWQTETLSASYLANQYVKVAFNTPVSLEQYYAAIKPLLVGGGEVDKFVAVAKVNGKWGEEHVVGAPTADNFAERIAPLDGSREVRYSIDGIMATGVYLGAAVSPSVLQGVEALPYVYMVDTTPILLAKQADIVIDSYRVASPYYLFLD